MSVWDHYSKAQFSEDIQRDYEMIGRLSRRHRVVRRINWYFEWFGLRIGRNDELTSLVLKTRLKGTVLFGVFMLGAGVLFTAPLFPDVLEGERIMHLLVVLGMFWGNGFFVLYLERQEWRKEQAREFWRFAEELLEEELAREAEFEGGNP